MHHEKYYIQYTIIQLGRRKFIFRVWNLMPKKSKGNNHTSKINVFPCVAYEFFPLEGSKNGFLWPAGGKQIPFWIFGFDLLVEKTLILLVSLLPSLSSGIKLHTHKINFFLLSCIIYYYNIVPTKIQTFK